MSLEGQKPGATVVPILLSSDRTQVTVFGTKTAYPVYLTIGNLPKDIRCKPSQRCYRITCTCDRLMTNFLFRFITLFTYGFHLPLSVISSFGTPINIVNIALPTTHPYMDEVALFSKSSRALGRGPFHLPCWYTFILTLTFLHVSTVYRHPLVIISIPHYYLICHTSN
jgi:hypothetical protein